jgi:hypothetical protein
MTLQSMSREPMLLMRSMLTEKMLPKDLVVQIRMRPDCTSRGETQAILRKTGMLRLVMRFALTSLRYRRIVQTR